MTVIYAEKPIPSKPKARKTRSLPSCRSLGGGVTTGGEVNFQAVILGSLAFTSYGERHSVEFSALPFLKFSISIEELFQHIRDKVG